MTNPDASRSERGDRGSSEWISDPFRSFVEKSSDLFTVVDLDGRFLYVNHSALRYLGLSPEECIGRSAFDFVHEKDRERTQRSFAAWLESADSLSHTFENRGTNARDGSVAHLLWTITPQLDEDGQIVSFASIARDITELRRVERELVGSEVRLRALLSGMLDAMISIDRFGFIQEASDSCLPIFGYRPDELVGRNIKLLMPEPHHSKHDGYLERYARTGETWILNTTREFEVVKKSGEAFTCELSVSRIDIPGSDRPLFSGSFRDVSERKRAERALAESERRFRALFDQEFQYVGMLSPDGTLLEANQASLDLAGCKRSDVVGKPFWETPWFAFSEAAQDEVRESIAKAARGEFVRYETDQGSRSGLRSVDFSLKPIVDADGIVQHLIAEGRDVTDIVQARQRETSMLRALAQIGESASVLAHEIKNPITAVNAALRAVAQQLGEEDQVILQDLASRMSKVEKVLRRTLTLAKPITLELEGVDLEALLAEVCGDLAGEAREANAELRWEVAEDTPTVDGDRQLLLEVVTNLARNAIEALELGGRVHLRAALVGDSEILLSVDDDGPGLTDTVMLTIFKPFFTTKEKGTGIGLALCKKIAEEHGGTITVDTSELGGARFEVRLPVRR